ncbi:hypothetical protein F0223_07005 [Vibrio coralliilyticus]|uniref:hypothetical protein n=1 Tax=Vibrio coralliilyticus TaxID=190893 RepID=UPI00148E19B5|nr:hypothetical protein [Vibrio coralliilyticus]NOI17976.1 hypothetical protein [Vibrio coralliilyticus]
MSKSFSHGLMLLATILACVFAGIQTFSSWGIFSEKLVQYDFMNISDSKNMTGEISDISITVRTTEGIKELNSPLFFDLLIKNTGDVDLAKSDFDSDINFSFKGDVDIIKYQQVDQSHSSIETSIKIDGNTLSISPLLLNSEDYFVLRVLIDGKPDKIIAALRILGMTEEFTKIKDESTSALNDIIIILYCLLCFFYMGKMASVDLISGVKYNQIDGILTFFLVYIGGLYSSNQSIYFDKLNSFVKVFLIFSPAIICFLYYYILSKSRQN